MKTIVERTMKNKSIGIFLLICLPLLTDAETKCFYKNHTDIYGYYQQYYCQTTVNPGIIAGVVVGIVLIIGSIIGCIIYRRRRRRSEEKAVLIHH